MPDPIPINRGRKPNGHALSGAERQRRYRERQKAKLATAESADTLHARLVELNAENDRLAVQVDQLRRSLQAKENAIARLTKALDDRGWDLEFLRSRVARWKADDESQTTAEPIRPKAGRKKPVT